MNKELQRFARNELKAGLAVLPLTHHAIFKRMYSKNNLDADIGDVVDSMDEDKLDWAMTQVQNSIDGTQTKKTSN